MYLKKKSFPIDPVCKLILYCIGKNRSLLILYCKLILYCIGKIVVKSAVGSHCCHCSLLAVVNFTPSSDCWLLKSHCQQSLLATACSEQSLLASASSEKSLLPTASSEQSLLLLPTVTAVCVHARASMCAEVYMYHSTGKLSTFMPFYKVLTQNVIPLEGKSGRSLLLLPTVTTVDSCVCARSGMHAYWSIHISFHRHDF